MDVKTAVHIFLRISLSSIATVTQCLSNHAPNDSSLSKDGETAHDANFYDDNPLSHDAMCVNGTHQSVRNRDEFTKLPSDQGYIYTNLKYVYHLSQSFVQMAVTLFNPIHVKQPILLYLIIECFIVTFATYDQWTLIQPEAFGMEPNNNWDDARIGHSISNKQIVLSKNRKFYTFNYTNNILTHYGGEYTYNLPQVFGVYSFDTRFAQVGSILYILGNNLLNKYGNVSTHLHMMHTINVDTLESHQDVGLYVDTDDACLTVAQNRYIIQTGGLGDHRLRIYDTLNYSVHMDGPRPGIFSTSHTCAVAQNRLFVIGGFSAEVKFIDISDINAIGSQSWVRADDLHEQRIAAVSFVFGTDIMVVGGYVALSDPPIFSDTVEVINALTGSVTIEGYIPLPVARAVGIAINDTAYLFGGHQEGGGIFDGYQTVYTGATKPPTADPTVDPTVHPSNDPSQSPTDSPSQAPSYSPTDSPSKAPTAAPSNAPTTPPSNAPSKAPSKAPTAPPSNAPTYPPTLAPSNTPSTPPSGAPTEVPTRYPTKRNAYSKELIVSFVISGNITQIVNDDGIQRILVILEDAYVIVSGQFKLLFLGEQLEYRYFEVVMDRKQININRLHTGNLTMHMSVKYEEDDIGDSIRFISRQTMFREHVTDELRSTFSDHSDLSFSVSDVYETDEPIDAFDYVFPSLATIMGATWLLAFGALVFNKKDTKIDDAAWTALVMFGLQVFDLGSDVNLCVEILLQFETVFELSLLYVAGYGSLFFVIVPYIANIILASKMKEIVAGNGVAVSYFEQRSALFVTLVIFSGGAYPVLALMSSRVFALEIFDCGLTRYELMRLSKLKIFGTVVLENIPQMCFQLLYISYSGVPSQNTILSSIASFLSIVGACLSYCIQKQGGDCFVNQYDLQFKKVSNQALTEPEKKQILAKKECKKALRYALSSALDVVETQLELGFVNMSQSGFVMHIVHYTSKLQLDNFNDGGTFYGDENGPDSQIYHHLVTLFTERLYTVKSDKVNQAFHTHFGFSKKESVEFKVKYHKHFGYNSLLYTSMGNVLGETKKHSEIELASSMTTNYDAKENDVNHTQAVHNLVDTVFTTLGNNPRDGKDQDRLYTQLTAQNDKELIDHIFAIWRLSLPVQANDNEEETPAEIALAEPETKTKTNTMAKIQSYSTANEGGTLPQTAGQNTTGDEANQGEDTPNSEQDDTGVDELVAIAMQYDEATD